MQGRQSALAGVGSLQQRSRSTTRTPRPLFPPRPRLPTDRIEERQPQPLLPELESCITSSMRYQPTSENPTTTTEELKAELSATATEALRPPHRNLAEEISYQAIKQES